MFQRLLALVTVVAALVSAQSTNAPNVASSADLLKACKGYSASDVKTSGSTLTATLNLVGDGCAVYGPDIKRLQLQVEYQTKSRLHVKITDASSKRYEVPESVLRLPSSGSSVTSESSDIQFKYTSSPFSFSIHRTKSDEVLFSTENYPLIFEPQYLRVKTSLPNNVNIYGLGEHTNNFRLPTHNFTRTLWSRDAFGVAPDTNLYGNHPIYFEHRKTGTHGVFLRNSNGMDIKIDDTGSTSLEYNIIGGVLDFYFLAGSEQDPTELARQYAELVGTPAEVPYWSFGFHQCRFGYRDFVDVANVISNYSLAGIPLETMWTDIDYMDRRRIFTLEPNFFPLKRMRDIVSYLHSHDQKYIMMIDPAVAYLPGSDYGAYNRGTEQDVWLKSANGTASLGIVWPGVTVYPDWFNPKTKDFWTNEFGMFFNKDTGVDIDGAWIDMNEPASFCNYPCDDPFQQAKDQGLPPVRTSAPPDPNTPIFQNDPKSLTKREDWLNPPYHIKVAAGAISDRTAYTDAKHFNGMREYDTHNLYGTMMSTATRDAMLARRAGKRTLIITRSTFAGAGSFVGKWLGDNLSDWEHYRNSIAGMLGFASIYQVPMVGADICGFGSNTTETLCARWATLGAFYPFMRNHNIDNGIPQEFYRWKSVEQAAKNALDMRYRLMDYIYTSFHQAHLDGSPVLNPVWYKYPQDANTYPIDLQFFFGDSILVSPVTQENSTSATIYLPKDIFYDFKTFAPVQGKGANVTLSVGYTDIPVHIRGGSILPLRSKSAMTTTELRKQPYEIVVAPGLDGTASGQLYIDDGESITPGKTTLVQFKYTKGKLYVDGQFGYDAGVGVSRIRFLGVSNHSGAVKVNGQVVEGKQVAGDVANAVLDVPVGVPLGQGLSVEF
jgi:alpha-glucosidase